MNENEKITPEQTLSETFVISAIMPEGHEDTYLSGFAYELSDSFGKIHRSITEHIKDKRKEGQKVVKFEIKMRLDYEETDKPYKEPAKIHVGWLDKLK